MINTVHIYKMSGKYTFAEIGSGAYGTAFRVKSSTRTAVKKHSTVELCNKADALLYTVDSLRVCYEALILRWLTEFDHPNIIKLLHINRRTISAENSVQPASPSGAATPTAQPVGTVTLTLQDGGDSLRSLFKAPSPALNLVRKYLAETARALDFLHRKGIIHGDIKSDNIVVEGGVARLIDFNLSACPGMTSENLIGVRNSPWNQPLESIMRFDAPAPKHMRIFGRRGSCWRTSYTSAVDIWGLGCVFAELLFWMLGVRAAGLFDAQGRAPSRHEQLQSIFDIVGAPAAPHIIAKVKEYNEYLMPGWESAPNTLDDLFSKVSDPHAVDLLKKMLALDPAERPTASELLGHPFLAAELGPELKNVDAAAMPDMIDLSWLGDSAVEFDRAVDDITRLLAEPKER